MTNLIEYPKTAIIIVSYNACKMMQENILSIRKTVKKGTYHIYVVDNASTDGVGEWLKEQEASFDDISVLINNENVGFPKGCNLGVELAEKRGDYDSDIFLLNNDTQLCKNSLFNLKEALYSSDDIGATGSISNYVGNKQQVGITFKTVPEYIEYGNKQNILHSENSENFIYEERVRLSGFAMLIKRNVWNKAGGMDESFSPGYYEDDDLSMKILIQGKRILLCLNSFIYHAGSQSFSKINELNSILNSHYKIFKEKYGFPILKYAYPDEHKLDEFKFEEKKEYWLLHLGCGIGACIKYIRSKNKNVHVYGVEKNKKMQSIASATDKVYSTLQCLVDGNVGVKFDAIYTDSTTLESMTDEEINRLRMTCKENAMINVKSSVDYSKIKLIVWNPGNIFWNYDLQKGNVLINDQRMKLIGALTDCGIVSSISAIKDGELVEYIFNNTGVGELLALNDYSVVDIEESIRKKMSRMGTNPSEVMYIDDNIDILVDVDEKIDGIIASDSGAIAELLDYVCNNQRMDYEHNTLKRVKQLEHNISN